MLYIHPEGGLCNRIFAIDATRQLCSELGVEYGIIWKNNAECACNFEDIFSIGKDNVKNILLAKRRFRENLKEYGIAKAVIERAYSYKNADYLDRYKIRLDITKNDTYDPAELMLKIKNLLNEEKICINTYFQYYGETDITEEIFSRPVLERARARRKEYGHYVALHIRRTDHIKCIRENPIDEYFEKKIVEEIANDPAVKIYIATDDTGVYDLFLKRYRDNIIELTDIQRSRLSKEGIQDAVCELLILAGAERIYGSRGSTFTDVACLLHKKLTEDSDRSNMSDISGSSVP